MGGRGGYVAESGLKPTDRREVGAEPVQILTSDVRTRSPRLAADAMTTALDDRCAFDGGNGLTADSRQAWEQRLDHATFQERQSDAMRSWHS